MFLGPNDGTRKGDIMTVAIQEVGGIAVATPHVDRLDVRTVPEFRDEMNKVVETYTKVILNMDMINFVDSTGLGALMSCIRRLNLKGGGLRMIALQQQPTAMFRLVRMHKVVDTFETLNDAVAGW